MSIRKLWHTMHCLIATEVQCSLSSRQKNRQILSLNLVKILQESGVNTLISEA